uniref:Uncharacterized protein n=1 Tax=Cannabis sativa TaxID=3483 RepID=A0A803PZL5_CANSA
MVWVKKTKVEPKKMESKNPNLNKSIEFDDVAILTEKLVSVGTSSNQVGAKIVIAKSSSYQGHSLKVGDDWITPRRVGNKWSLGKGHTTPKKNTYDAILKPVFKNMVTNPHNLDGVVQHPKLEC